jgi:hypothetical protein
MVDAAARVRETKRLQDWRKRHLDLICEEESLEHLMRIRYAEYGDALIIVKFPEFESTPSQVSEVMDKNAKP